MNLQSISMTKIIGFVASVAAAALLAPGAGAQDLIHKAAPQTRPIVIEHATIHTVSSGVIHDGSLWFSGGVIRGIARPGESLVGLFPASPIRINAAGMHVYPGLVSGMTGLGLTEISAVNMTNDSNEQGANTPEVKAVVAINPDSTLFPVARSNGVLVAGVAPGGGTIAGRAGVVRLDGWTWEDMTINDNVGLVISWPRLAPFRSPFLPASFNAKAQLKRSKETLSRIDALFDEAEAYFAARDADPSIPTDVRLDALRSAIEGTSRVFIQASEMEQIESAVSWAVKRGLKPVIVGGNDAPKVAALLKRHDVPVMLSGALRTPSRRDSPYDEAFTAPIALQEAGVAWCISSGGGASNERNLPYQAAASVAYGLDPDAALRAITLSTAEILGVDDAYGSIDEGKSATLFLADGDILDVRTHVLDAFIDGRRIDLRNKQTALRDKYRDKYRQLGLIQTSGDQSGSGG